MSRQRTLRVPLQSDTRQLSRLRACVEVNRTGVVPLGFALVASVLLLFVLPIESVKSLLGAVLNFTVFADELELGVDPMDTLCLNVNTVDDTWGE